MYDVVVAGAGCAGAVFAARMAARGFHVLLLDREREEAIGPNRRDVVEREAFELASVDRPVAPEAGPASLRIGIFTSDSAKQFSVSGEPYTLVDRKLLAARLLKEARDAGAEVVTQCIAGGAEVDRGRVTTVLTDRGAFPTRLAVDASGADRVICRNLPRGIGVPRVIGASDYFSLYSETREREPGAEAPDGADEGRLEFHGGRFMGYRWLNDDHGRGMVDIGAAVQDAPDAPDPRAVTQSFALAASPAVGRVIRSGGGRIPARRPLNSMVAGAFMVIGDAACQALPVSCRGVGGAMIAAALAADAAAFGLEAGDVSPAGLWSYNHCYMRERGAHAAALDCIRVFLQGITDDDLRRLVKKSVMNERDIACLMQGRFEMPGAQSRIMSLLKGPAELSLATRFQGAFRDALRVFEHYMAFPPVYDQPTCTEWSREAEYLFEDVARSNEKALLSAV